MVNVAMLRLDINILGKLSILRQVDNYLSFWAERETPHDTRQRRADCARPWFVMYTLAHYPRL